MAKKPKSWQRSSFTEALVKEGFRYVNVIRRPDGSLRPWEEHNCLATYERYANGNSSQTMNYPSALARKIKDKEDAKRKR